MKRVTQMFFVFISLIIGSFMMTHRSSAHHNDYSQTFLPIIFNGQDSEIYPPIGNAQPVLNRLPTSTFTPTSTHSPTALVTSSPIPTLTPTSTPTPTKPPILPLQTIQGWKASYFNNPDLADPPTFVADHETIDFNWGYGSPHPDIGYENFSIRFERTIGFIRGDYRFTVQADDGFRIWIDDGLVYEQWGNGGDQSYSFDRYLEGDRRLRIEYYEGIGTANIRFGYELLSSSPGWTVSYFDNMNLTGEPVLTRHEPCPDNKCLDYQWGTQAPTLVSVDADRWSARWIGEFNFEAGSYTFRVQSDDGIRLYLDGNLLLEDWTTRYKGHLRAYIPAVSAGHHTVTIEYFEFTGPALLKVWWNRTDVGPHLYTR